MSTAPPRPCIVVARPNASAAAPRTRGAKTKPTSPEDRKSASPTLRLDDDDDDDDDEEEVEEEEEEKDEDEVEGSGGTTTASAVSMQCACSAEPWRLVLPLQSRIDARKREWSVAASVQQDTAPSAAAPTTSDGTMIGRRSP